MKRTAARPDVEEKRDRGIKQYKTQLPVNHAHVQAAKTRGTNGNGKLSGIALNLDNVHDKLDEEFERF
jgi:hypothetical protein